ncbi:MAG: TldD/PmbA family protein [Mobilitalea sp.]
MKVKNSDFLVNSKPLVRKLIDMLSISYQYVSVLGTDTKGKSYRVTKMGTEVNDIMLAERGFVVRIHNGVNYSEYSFNEISEDKLVGIVEDIQAKLSKVAEEIKVNSYEVIEEKEITDSFISELEIDPEEISSEVIIKELTGIKDAACACSDLVVNFRASYNIIHVSKIFMSNKKDLTQSYQIAEAYLFAVARKEEKSKYYFKSYSGMKGYEIINELKKEYKEVVDQSIKLLEAKTVIPGEYDVICAPDITGLIAHEAFGHGVEMDMFVKGRAKGAEYIGKEVASKLTTMHDGAAAAKHMSSYLFDDEGTLGTDTIEIQNGILKAGISDLLSALKLGTTPTGNGKRESYERKAYARMTNTFFEAGKDKYEDMISSIKYGYLLEGMYSGMEDPKNWGIQCIALLGREIKDGKITGNLISPVVMTGFVPDLLKSISMVSEVVELEGAGYCGKGYKEFVKTSNGGPFIKTKVRLG